MEINQRLVIIIVIIINVITFFFYRFLFSSSSSFNSSSVRRCKVFTVHFPCPIDPISNAAVYRALIALARARPAPPLTPSASAPVGLAPFRPGPVRPGSVPPRPGPPRLRSASARAASARWPLRPARPRLVPARFISARFGSVAVGASSCLAPSLLLLLLLLLLSSLLLLLLLLLLFFVSLVNDPVVKAFHLSFTIRLDRFSLASTFFQLNPDRYPAGRMADESTRKLVDFVVVVVFFSVWLVVFC